MERGWTTTPGLRLLCRHRRAPVAPLLAVLAVTVLLANVGGVSSTLYEGSPCFHEEGQLRGVCKLLPYCSWAVKERRSGLYPQTCSFDGYMPVVCCPYTRTHDPPHLPLRPHRPFMAPDPADVPALVAGMTPPPTLLPGALEMTGTSSPTSPEEQQTLGPASVQLQAGVAGALGPLEPWPSPIPSEPDHLKEEVGAASALDRLGASASTSAPLLDQDTESSIQLGDGSAAFAHGR